MKRLSVFQVILLASFGAIAIAAVLIFAFAVGGGSTSTTGAVRIWGTLDETAFTTVIRQAAENNPNLSQVTYEQQDPETYDKRLTDALASGQGPDLFLFRQDNAFSDASKVIPIPFTSLTESQFSSAFVDAASPFISQSGVLAIPLLVDPLVLYWNKDTLSTAGYAKAPQFWDELYKIAGDITKKTDAGTIQKSALPFGEYRNVNGAKAILSTLILQAGGNITTRDTAGNLVSAISPRTGETAQSTANALRFYTEFADPSKPHYTWNRALPEARKSFAAGDLALYIGNASEEPLIRRMNPNLNFSVSAVPQIRGAARAVVTGYVYGLAVPRTSSNPSGAAIVAFDLAGAEMSRALSTALGIPSVRRDVLSMPAEGNDVIYNRQAIITRSWVDPDPEKTEVIFRDMIESTVSGAALVTEAVQRADQEMAAMLGQ
jgi:ABC-type glycerol-3-phosphate transport system substrate-binding protein